MKIGILTHPLHTNFGGLLQAYALQTILIRLGHQVDIIHKEYTIYKVNTAQKIYDTLKNLIRFFLNKRLKGRYGSYKLEKSTNIFKRKFLKISRDLYSTEELRQFLKKQKYDAIIVGSDQVWRPKYSPCITNYFLDFTSGFKLRRIAYAASFGVEEWEFSAIETQICKDLARKFDKISVREVSGVRLCQHYLKVNATHVLDPTLLLGKTDYLSVVGNETLPSDYEGLFCYVLDIDQNKLDIIENVSSILNKKALIATTDSNQCCFLRVTQWIKAISESQMVITDSFHGAVFCIIFNKPFWVVANQERGLDRLTSLLGEFGLEDRIISQVYDIKQSQLINWEKVNATKRALRKKSIEFLLESLS